MKYSRLVKNKFQLWWITYTFNIEGTTKNPTKIKWHVLKHPLKIV